MAETNIYGEEIVDTTGKPVETGFDDLPDVVAEEPKPEAKVSASGFADLPDIKEYKATYSGGSVRNRNIVLKSLEDYGASPVVQAALAGDIEQESSFSPALDDHNDPTGAHGLFQIGNQMWKEFEAAAKADGLKPTDPDYVYGQVPFVLNRFKAQHPDRWDAMQKSNSAADVVELFRGHPDWGYGIAGRRHLYADKYQKLLSQVPTSALIAGELTGSAEGAARPPKVSTGGFGDIPDIGEKERILPHLPRDHGFPDLPDEGGAGQDFEQPPGTPGVPEPDDAGDEIEIPDLLKKPEDEEEEASAAAAPRPRITIGGGTQEIPEAFKVRLQPPDYTPIPTGAPELSDRIPIAEGAIQDIPPQMEVPEPGAPPPMLAAPAEMPEVTPPGAPAQGAPLPPMQEQFARIGSSIGKVAKGMVPPDLKTADEMVTAQGVYTHDPVGWVKSLVDAGEMGFESGKALLEEPVGSQRWWDTFVPLVLQGLPLLGSVKGPRVKPGPTLKAQTSALLRARAKGLAAEAKAAGPATEELMGLTKEQVNELQYGSKFARVGPQRARAELARLSPAALLKRKLQAEERAGKAGVQRGKLEAEALAKAKATDIRETLATANRWLDADIATVRAKLLSFTKHLPGNERGKFLAAITSALRKPAAWTRDPGVVKRRAEAVLNRMAERVYEVNKARITKEIRKGLLKIIGSPTVAVSQKQIARQMLNTFEQLHDRMSLDMLEAMRRRMRDVEMVGRNFFRRNEANELVKTQDAIEEIRQQGILKADIPEEFRMSVDDVAKFWQTWRENVMKIPSTIKYFNHVVDPMDWVFMRFDGRLSGALYRNLKLRIDIKYSEFLNARDAFQMRRNAVKEKYKLNDKNYERIAFHAELRQAGGEANLKARGIPDVDIQKYKNLGALSEGEKALLKVDDAINAELYPILRDVYANHFNIEIGPDLPGYYPRIRDWDWYNSLSIEEGRFTKGQFAHRQTKTASGMTKARQEGAVTKNQINSDLIMNKHIEDVLYTTMMGPDISAVAKVVRTPEFGELAGTFGRELFADWVDTLARNGGAGAGRRFHFLDLAKKNIGVGYLALRLTTMAVQPLALVLSMPLMSKTSLAYGISSIFSKADRKWILDTFPEVRESVSGGKIDDPAYAVYDQKGMQRAVMSPIRWLDGFARMSAVEGFYRDALLKRGLPFDRNAVPHPEAVAEAQQMVRMTQAGPLFKDAPQAISRGKLSQRFLGYANVSVDQALLQFQSYILNKYSYTKYLGFGRNIKEAPVPRSRIIAYLILASYLEQLGRKGIKTVQQQIIGMMDSEKAKAEEGKSLPREITERVALDLLTSIPGISNAYSIAAYESTGVPVADAAIDVFSAAGSVAFKATSGTSKTRAAARGAAAAGALAGYPTKQIQELLDRMLAQKGGKYEGPYDMERLEPLESEGLEPLEPLD